MADDAPKKTCPHVNELSVGPDLGDGARPFVRHTEDHDNVLGVMRPLREGEPITSDAFKVEVKDPIRGIYVSSPVISGGKPAKVNSKAFKSGWDVTFGGSKPVVGQA